MPKAKSAPAPKAKQPPKPSPKKQAKKKMPSRSGPLRGPVGAPFLHPRLSASHLTTPSLSATPYVVVRDKITVTVSPSTTVDRTVLMIGGFNGGLEGTLSSLYGILGSGTAVPGGASDSGIYGVNFQAGVHTGRVRIHRIGVRVVNTGGSSSNTVPDGKFWMGTLRGTVRRNNFIDYNALGAWLVGRNELREYTNYSAFTSSKTAVCTPFDFLDWESFKDSATIAGPNVAVAMDTLSQVAIVMGPVKNAQSFDIQLDVELTSQFTTDPLLNSLSKHHPSVPDDVWHAARRFVSEHAPVLEEGAAVAGAAMLGPEALGAAAAYMGSRAFAPAAARLGGRGVRALMNG